MTLNTRKQQKNAKPVTLQVAPHPFAVERVTHQLPAGASVAEMLAVAQPDAFLRRYAHVFLDGHKLLPENWNRTYPKAGTQLSVRMVPQGGGGGKNPLRTVLTIAVMAAAPVIASGLASAMGATGAFMGISTARLLTAGVSLVGRLALNAIAPPPKPRFSQGQQDSPVYFLQGAQNRVNPFGRVPKVLGRHRFVPPYGALPYTETIGNDQYLRLLFVWGYGPLNITDLKIGETPLSEFDNVEIETRQGHPAEQPLTLYSNAVLQNDLQVALKQTAGYIVRTTEADAEEISVDVTFPRGLFKFGSGSNKLNHTVELEVQYAPTGSDDWSAASGTYKTVAAQAGLAVPRPAAYVQAGVSIVVSRIDRVVLDMASGAVRVVRGTTSRAGIDAAPAVPAVPPGFRALAQVMRRSDQSAAVPAGAITDERGLTAGVSGFSAGGDFEVEPGSADDTIDVAAGGLQYKPLAITAKQATTLRRSVSFKVPKGVYDVRLRRLTADSESDKIFDECLWTALRTVRSANPVRMQGVAMTALRIKATDQLNGMVERFNGVVEAIIPDWTGSDWVWQPTSNPASIYRHVLQGAGNARPLANSRIDLDRLQQWHERCRLSGREYNGIVDYDVSVREVLQDVAALGRASPAVVDGRWSVVEDMPQAVPVQHFTPRNTFGFEAHKAFEELPQALRVRFVNREKGWVQDERLVFVDGVSEETATHYETLQMLGVTSPDQAWREGRYHLASARLRPEIYQFSADMEHLVCTRGDMVRLTHDVPMFGISSARVRALVLNDEGQVTGVTLDDAVAQVPTKNYSIRFRRNDGTSLLSAVAAQDGLFETVMFATPVAPEAAPEAGDLAMFGEAGSESVELVVKGIEPQGDLSARISCVDAAPDIHLAESGEIPVYQSHITIPDALRVPPVPEVAEIQSGEESLIRNTDGSLTTRIVITLQPAAFSLPLKLQVMIRGEGESLFRPAEILSETPTQISIVGVEEGQDYDLQLRYVTSADGRSPARVIHGYQVRGTAALPSDVQGLQVTVLGDMLSLGWQAVLDADLSHYVLRYTPETGSVNWSNAIDVVSRIAMDATSLSLPAATGSYLLKAVDVGGRQSAVPAVAVASAGLLPGYNAVINLLESPHYSGVKTGLALIDGTLRLDGADSIDGWEDFDAQASIDLGSGGLLMAGEYAFASDIDLGGVYTSRITAIMHIEGVDLSQSVDQWPAVDDIESWDENIDPSLWSTVLEICTSQEDPANETAWSGWQPLVIGDYTARSYRFRLRLQSVSPNISPVVTHMNVLLDMPDRNETGSGIVSGPGAKSIDFGYPFRDLPALSLTPRNMASGDYYTLTAMSESGFTVTFFNAGGTQVSRTFDYVAQGYGRLV